MIIGKYSSLLFIAMIAVCSVLNGSISYANNTMRQYSAAQDTIPPKIFNTWNLDSTLNRVGPYQVRTFVMDDDTVMSVKLVYNFDGGLNYPDTTKMLFNRYDHMFGWWGLIKPHDTLSPGTVVAYKIIACDRNDNCAVDPAEGNYSFTILNWPIDIDFTRDLVGLCQYDYERDYWDDGVVSTDDASNSWCAPTATASCLRWLNVPELPANDHTVVDDLANEMNTDDQKSTPPGTPGLGTSASDGIAGIDNYLKSLPNPIITQVVYHISTILQGQRDNYLIKVYDSEAPIGGYPGANAGQSFGDPTFDDYRKELLAGEDVLLWFSYPGDGGHVVTGQDFGNVLDLPLIGVMDPACGSDHVPIIWGNGVLYYNGQIVNIELMVVISPKVVPKIDQVVPNKAEQGSQPEIKITGSGLTPQSNLTFNPSTGITVDSVEFMNTTSIVAYLSIDNGSPTGLRDIIITNPGDSADTLENGFNILASEPPVISNTWDLDSTLNRVGPYQIRTKVTDNDSVKSVDLIYSFDDGLTWADTAQMQYNPYDSTWGWWGLIESPDTLLPNTNILYYIRAVDWANNTIYDPPSGSYDLFILDWIINIDFSRILTSLCQFDYERDYWDDGDATTDDASNSWCAPTATASCLRWLNVSGLPANDHTVVDDLANQMDTDEQNSNPPGNKGSATPVSDFIAGIDNYLKTLPNTTITRVIFQLSTILQGQRENYRIKVYDSEAPPGGYPGANAGQTFGDPTFNDYCNELLAGEDVLLWFYYPGDGGHVVTGQDFGNVLGLPLIGVMDPACGRDHVPIVWGDGILFYNGQIVNLGGMISISPNPEINGVDPPIGAQGAYCSLDIQGERFVNGATLSFYPMTGITIDSIRHQSSSLLIGYLKIDSTAPIGLRDVIVTNPGGESDTLIDGFEITSPLIVTHTYYFVEGWNMVSVPLIVENYQESILFPEATSDAFTFAGSYISVDTLNNGDGYWLKFDEACEIIITGQKYDLDTINVVRGWNMIGTIPWGVDPDSVTSIPSEMVKSDFFGYDGNYFVANSLSPGKAYWIKTDIQGRLIMKKHSAMLKK